MFELYDHINFKLYDVQPIQTSILKQNDSLYQMTDFGGYDNDYRNPYGFTMNYLVLQDTVYKITGLNPELSIKKEKLFEFNQLFFDKVKSIPGINWQSCVIPTASYNFFHPDMFIQNNTFEFIIHNIEIFGQKEKVQLKISYKEMEPYLKKNDILYKWIKLSLANQKDYKN